MNKLELAHQIKQLLDDVIELDPATAHHLIRKAGPCTEALANHPSIQVREYTRPRGQKGYAVSALGILNGLIGPEYAVALIVPEDDPYGGIIHGTEIITLEAYQEIN